MEWFQFGIHLGIPHYELSIIKADYQDVRRCKTEMLLWWLKNSIEAKWSTIVRALVKAGMRAVAHMIAQDHGTACVIYNVWTCFPNSTLPLLLDVPTEDFTDMSEAAKTVEPPTDMVCAHGANHAHKMTM